MKYNSEVVLDKVFHRVGVVSLSYTRVVVPVWAQPNKLQKAILVDNQNIPLDTIAAEGSALTDFDFQPPLMDVIGVPDAQLQRMQQLTRVAYKETRRNQKAMRAAAKARKSHKQAQRD